MEKMMFMKKNESGLILSSAIFTKKEYEHETFSAVRIRIARLSPIRKE